MVFHAGLLALLVSSDRDKSNRNNNDSCWKRFTEPKHPEWRTRPFRRGYPYPFDLDVDGQNNLYFINGGYLIDRIDTTTIYRVSQAGTISPAFTLAPQIPSTYAAQAVGISTAGDAAYVAVASIFGNSVVRLDSKGQTKVGSNCAISHFRYCNLGVLEFGLIGAGLIYVADPLNNRISLNYHPDNGRRLPSIAGTGTSGYSGDGGPAT